MKYFIRINSLLLILLISITSSCNLTDKGTNITDNDIGDVEGTVTDASNGKILTGVIVQIGDKLSETNSNGVYSLNNIGVGSCTISVNKTGYQLYSSTIQITKDIIVTNNIQLTPIPSGSNHPPIANAGPDKNVVTGSTVTFDGSKSSDPDGNPITYNWSFVSKPTGSAAIISGQNTSSSSFNADIDGTYKINLAVSDGTDSANDEVIVSASLSYNPTLDFSIDNGNPNGVWSYGWMPTNLSMFNLCTGKQTFNNLLPLNSNDNIEWIRALPDYLPGIWRNMNGFNWYGVGAGQIALHPGSLYEASVLRWTAPFDGQYNIDGQFFSGDTGIMQVGVRKGSVWLWQSTDSGIFNFDRSMIAGESIDFLVYGGYSYGNTPIELIISFKK